MGLRLTCLAVLCIASTGLMIGCLSNSSPPGEGPEDAGGLDFDTGVTPFDAGIVPDAFVPADGTIGDTSVPDSASPPDTSTPADAAPAPVTLVVVDTAGVPEPDVPVFFSDATGAVLTTDTTGASGTVTEVVPAGSQVTVLFGDPTTGANLVTIVGVAPGDRLTAVDVLSGSAFSEEVLVTTLPSLDGGADGGNFSVTAGNCSGSELAPPIALYLNSGCEVGGKFPLLASRLDENYAPVAFAFQTGNTVAPDGGLDDAGAQEVSMATDEWNAIGSLSVSATNAPPDGYIWLGLSEVSENVPLTSAQQVEANDGGAAVTIPTHPNYADFTQTAAIFPPQINGSGNGDGSSFSAIVTRSAGATAPSSFDLSTALPPLTNALVDYANLARPTASWSGAAPLTSIDGTIVSMDWYFYGPSETYAQSSWTFVVPPTTSVVQAPALPPSLSGWAPQSGSYFQGLAVLAVDASFLPGYAAFRAGSASVAAAAPLAYQCFSGDNLPNCIPPLPTEGTLLMSVYVENND